MTTGVHAIACSRESEKLCPSPRDVIEFFKLLPFMRRDFASTL